MVECGIEEPSATKSTIGRVKDLPVASTSEWGLPTCKQDKTGWSTAIAPACSQMKWPCCEARDLCQLDRGEAEATGRLPGQWSDEAIGGSEEAREAEREEGLVRRDSGGALNAEEAWMPRILSVRVSRAMHRLTRSDSPKPSWTTMKTRRCFSASR